MDSLQFVCNDPAATTSSVMGGEGGEPITIDIAQPGLQNFQVRAAERIDALIINGVTVGGEGGDLFDVSPPPCNGVVVGAQVSYDDRIHSIAFIYSCNLQVSV